MHEITNPGAETYFANIGPLSGTVHEGSIPADATMRTGQPLVVYKTDAAELRALVFASHEDDTGEESELHPIAFSTYTDLSEAQALKNDVNSFDFLKVIEFKHPDRDEWALAAQDQCLAAMPDGAAKTRIVEACELSIAEGRRKTLNEMLADGWA